MARNGTGRPTSQFTCSSCQGGAKSRSSKEIRQELNCGLDLGLQRPARHGAVRGIPEVIADLNGARDASYRKKDHRIRGAFDHARRTAARTRNIDTHILLRLEWPSGIDHRSCDRTDYSFTTDSQHAS